MTILIKEQTKEIMMQKFNFSKSNLRSAGISFLIAGIIVSFAALFSPDQHPVFVESGPKQKQEETIEGIATVLVTENSTVQEIGQSLADQGMIDDLETFSEFMVENGYHKNFQAGEYQINIDMTMKDIAQVITGQTELISSNENK